MAENAEGSSSEITFKVKTSGDKMHTVTMADLASVADLKTKLSGEDYENIPIERQRLIYSGRVMKNEEPLSTYKIKAGNTVHLVKSAASNPAPAPPASSTAAAPQVPTNMAAGTANNPLAGLTGARYAGLTNLPSADMFGPDGGMVGSQMDEEHMARMLDDPNVAQQMNEMLNNDQFLDMMIQGNPMLRNNPNARNILRSPMMRQMMTNPDAMRQAARFSRMMRGSQGGAGAFPAPGVTDTTPAEVGDAGNNNDNNNSNQTGQPNLFDPSIWGNIGVPGAGAAGVAGGAANPLASMFSPLAMGGQPAAAAQGQAGTGNNTTQSGEGPQTENGNTQSTAGTGQANAAANPFASLFGGGFPGTGAGAGANPFGAGMPPASPEALQQMMQLLGMNSPSGSPAPVDNRPPEERYAEQLRQLNDMGFFDFDRNIAALRRSGGSVQGAIEHLLNN